MTVDTVAGVWVCFGKGAKTGKVRTVVPVLKNINFTLIVDWLIDTIHYLSC